jgi:CYTH domain-containing protein
MPQEIERKFLLENDTWRPGAVGVRYRQGYLSTEKQRTVRVRTAGDKGYLTIKGESVGATRSEYEYTIPLADADEMLDRLCLRPIIEKVRYRIPFAGLTWEVDEFEGENAGLILAEVELQSEEQAVELPGWVGTEVTGDPRYFNSNLIAHPYTGW